eukprot:XP_001700596.1 predicted protein [Chlamydomonas reinhardtii]
MGGASGFSSGQEHLPVVDLDLVEHADSEYRSIFQTGSAEEVEAARFRLIWALVHSSQHRHQTRGLELCRASLAAGLQPPADREHRYLAAVACYKLGQYIEARRELARLLQPWPGDLFVLHWGHPEPWRALTLRQRRRLLCLAASSGHAPSLDAALEHAGCDMPSRALTSAAAAGNLAAFRYGHADALRYLLDECGVPLDTHDTFIMYMNFAEDVGSSGRLGATATGAAGANGHLAVLQLLRNEGVAFKAKDLVRQGCWHRAAAAVRMTWLMEVVVDAPGDGDGWSAVFVAAARGGAGLPLLRALRARGAAVDLDAVACGGSLEALEWAVEELAAERGEAALQVPVSPRYVRTIRIAGDNSTLDWLRGRGLLPPLLVRVRELQRDGGKGVGDADA